ncbi:MAG: cell division protein FtsZ [Propionivibrio sp.]|jgi:FtsZ-interacting cell division protein ZipA|uniref:cell division protein ZipA C-terminal FtsZ-binding domain-containing protein n=1 Tax=Propionivibrio sp. TaxID=2212460 RepID=UPI001B48AB89|nr:cell division protein ZipA C-terminal FtsZ-binding domain-containing protein [Propionivibrio sp.]MBP7201940.1 cell division protein FtsZ [Propionivibrio sp.]
MTELQMGLLGLGATAVVGVFAYNKWQEYRHRKLAEKVLDVHHADVLLEEAVRERPVAGPAASDADLFGTAAASPSAERETPPFDGEPVLHHDRIEPVLRFETEPAEESVDPAADVIDAIDDIAPPKIPKEPEHDPESLPEPVPALAPEATRVQADAHREVGDVPEPTHLLSPQVDFIAAFEVVEPAASYQILESQANVLARIRKPVHWLGFNETTREWDVIVDDGQSAYRRIRVGLQLVDRQGPASDGELSVFAVAMQDLAEEMMAIASLPARPAALQMAAELDAFCASVDIQIGINVISQGQVFAGTKLRALAEAAGMVIDAERRFVRCDEDGNVLYVLLNQENLGFSTESMKTMTTHGLTFLLDVPRVAHGERVFNQMVELARRFADVLRGSLVDDNRRPLSEGALEPIRKQVAQFQSTMAAHGLPAGGSLARRLFS